MNTQKFAFGTKVKDIVTGLEGQVTSYHAQMAHKDCYHVQPPLDKDGKWVEGHWFDVDRLYAVEINEVQNNLASV